MSGPFETKDTEGSSKAEKSNKKEIVVALIVLTIVVLSVSVPMISQNIIDANTYVLYRSPEGGESLTVGIWRFDDVSLPFSPWERHCMYQLQVEVLDWDGSSEQMNLLTIFTNATTYQDFADLNETQKDELKQRSYPSIVPDRTIIGGGFTSLHTTGIHLWGVKFAPDEGYVTMGFVQISITLTIRYE